MMIMCMECIKDFSLPPWFATCGRVPQLNIGSATTHHVVGSPAEG